MAYIDREKMLKYLEENNTADEWIIGQYNADWIYSFIESQPTADVVEVKDCEQCIHSGKHVTEYPCSYCRNCYTDKFQPNNTRTPKERGVRVV